jgi:hypothetical protein
LVNSKGTENWKEISSDLSQNLGIRRTSKQCSDRWYNALCVTSPNHKFTESEKNLVFSTFLTTGPHWRKITEKIKTKTENQIKNFMNATVRRNIRRFNAGKQMSERITTNSLDLLNFPEFRSILLADKSQPKSFFRDLVLSHEAFINMKKVKEKFVKDSRISEEEFKLIYEMDRVIFNIGDIDWEKGFDAAEEFIVDTDDMDK